jgi:uncharacterized protein
MMWWIIAIPGSTAVILAVSWYLSGKIRSQALTPACNPDPETEKLNQAMRSYEIEVTVPGPLGPLPAWFFPGESDIILIGVHGKGGGRDRTLHIAAAAHQLGHSALMVSYRNDWGVAPDPSGMFRYGITEWEDIQAAVLWAFQRGIATRVVLAGYSMGAGIIAAFLRESPYAKAVIKVIFDSPMLNLRECIRHQGRQISRVIMPLVWVAERIAARWVDWSRVNYLEETGWLKVPALVIHGDRDPVVPFSVSTRLKELCPSLVTFERFSTGVHGGSWDADRGRYAALTAAFLKGV